VSYPSEAACKVGAKVTSAEIRKLGIGRVDCIPVVQP
jgi:hypothetical protein